MAEELGHIDIRFPSAPGGAAGDTTGPLPSKISIPDIGADIANMMRAAAGDFTAIAKMVVQQVFAATSAIINFATTAASEMRERGKFSPDVLMENVAQQMQDLSNQFQEAKVLGPLYAMVLRWYRELMQLLQPWRLLFQTIIAFLAGAVLAMLKQLMTLVNKGLDGVLQVLSSLLKTIASYFVETVEKPGMVAQLGGKVVAGMIGQNQMADLITMVGQRALFGPVTQAFVDLAEGADKALKELRAINANTSTQSDKGIDWVAEQLREIASRSPNWTWRKGANPFYRTKGVGRLGGYP